MSKAFTAEFKLETAKLVLDQNYTQEEAAKATNVSRSAIGRWVRSLRLERPGKTSPGLPLSAIKRSLVKEAWNASGGSSGARSVASIVTLNLSSG